MSSRNLGFPVFDADNHMYETRDALTRYLPEKYRGAIDYVDVHGRTKIVVRGHITDYIPNPTFDRVGRPGAQEEYFKFGNPEGKTSREIIGRGIDCPPAFRAAEPRLTLMDEQGVTYRQLAAQTGLSAGYLNHLVHGNRPVPSNDVVKTLASALDVEPEHFREYRLRVITDRLEQMPELVDRLYKRLEA